MYVCVCVCVCVYIYTYIFVNAFKSAWYLKNDMSLLNYSVHEVKYCSSPENLLILLISLRVKFKVSPRGLPYVICPPFLSDIISSIPALG